MQETLLVFHLIGVAALLGGAFLMLIIGPRMAGEGGEAALGWACTASLLTRGFFIPAGILTLLTGIGLVLNGAAWG